MTRIKADIHMKGISVLWYGFKQGLKNIKHNGLFTLASIGTIAACLFLFGIFYFIVINVGHMVKSAESAVGITVFFDEGIDEASITGIGDAITAREEVDRIDFISAEEAWEIFKAEVFEGEEDVLTETFGDDNPLKDSASYEVYLNDISKQKELATYIEGLAGVREVRGSDAAASGLSNFNRLVGYISAAIIILLLAVSVFLINTTVTMGINVRKDEIAIMKLIGATDGFISLPFVIEGIIIGAFGAGIPLAILRFMYSGIVSFVLDKFSILSNILTFISVEQIFAVLIPVSFTIGIGIGFIGSVLTIRRYLKV